MFWDCRSWYLHKLAFFLFLFFSFFFLRGGGHNSRTPQDMDGTLTLIFAKSETPQDITTKISAFLQLRKKRILTEFEGCGSKNEPSLPI